MIRDERYQYIVNYSDTPRRPVDPAKQRPDSAYAQTAATGNEIDLVTQHPHHPAVRKFTALYVEPRPREELYDLETDPWELTNLAASPAHAAVKARLRAQLEAYQRQTKDPRLTGDLEIFNRTREFVLKRKFAEGGYASKQEEP
jgi:arylsulfatase A-like enzyme